MFLMALVMIHYYSCACAVFLIRKLDFLLFLHYTSIFTIMANNWVKNQVQIGVLYNVRPSSSPSQFAYWNSDFGLQL